MNFRYNPFFIGSEILLNMYTGMPIRKGEVWKKYLDNVIERLNEAGIIRKWLIDQFKPQVLLPNIKV